MRHLPGCRTVNSLVDSAEQLDSLQLSRGCGHIQSNTGSEKIHGFFFTCQIVIDVIKQKLGLKKKSVYTTKTYFTTDQRYLLQRATQHKKSLHIQQQHGNMLTCLNVSKSRQDSHKLKQNLKNKELWHLNYVSLYLKLLSESSRKSTHVKKKKKIHHILCIYAGLSHSASVLW